MIEDDRNYAVYAMLAGVRNNFTQIIGGISQPLEPISVPRGLPDDLDILPEDPDDDGYFVSIPDVFGKAYLGSHSFTWLTLCEILSWKGWQCELDLSYIISRQEY